MADLLHTELPAKTLVVAIDPGKVANRVWLTSGERGLICEPISLPVLREGVDELERLIASSGVEGRPIIGLEATGSLHTAWATELEYRFPGSLRLFAPSETQAARSQLGSRRIKADEPRLRSARLAAAPGRRAPGRRRGTRRLARRTPGPRPRAPSQPADRHSARRGPARRAAAPDRRAGPHDPAGRRLRARRGLRRPQPADRPLPDARSSLLGNGPGPGYLSVGDTAPARTDLAPGTA